TFGTAGELRAGIKWIHQRGDPSIAIKEFQTITTSETGARVQLRWDTLDHPYFPRNGLRLAGEGFYGNRSTEAFGETFESDNSSRIAGFADAAWSYNNAAFLNFHLRGGKITHARADNA